MNSPDHATARLHLRAAALALALLAVVVGVELRKARNLERKYVRAVVAENSRVKDLGIVWQRECFAQPDFLPLYGSSELIKRAPNKASQFFESYPSGFAISPVGRPSCTSLILLEKIAAGGAHAPGRKIAICISPVWFLARGANSVGFEGNFSTMQATELFYNAPLSLRLKHDIAGQMLRYPQIMQKSPVLAAAVWGLGGDRLIDRAIFFAAMPIGWLQNAVYRLQDHFEIVQSKRDDHKLYHLVAPKPAALDWDRLFAEAVPLVKPLPEDTADERLKQYPDDAAFLQALERSAEWGDFELLLQVVRELHLDPLLLSMPLEYAHFEKMGVSAQAIDAYARRVRVVAERYQVPVVDFSDLGQDPEFFADHFGHPSAKGWIYFDRALDDFFHGRLIRGRESPPPGDRTLSKTPGPDLSRSE